MRPRPSLVLALIGAAVGLSFAAVSTHDFVQHVDRDVHAVHCAYLPGLSTADASGTSGCQVAMMSPYSSVLRTEVWGGIPISLPAMAVFAFLVFMGLELAFSRRQSDVRATGFYALASCLPLLSSLAMAYVSFAQLESFCKLCIGIYAASAMCFAGAVMLWRSAAAEAPTEPGTGYEYQRRPTTSYGYLAGAFAAGLAFVLVPMGAYVKAMPEHENYIGSCGGLADTKDTYNIMVPVSGRVGGVPTVEILDPLCPACAAFEDRLSLTDATQQLERKAVLFPLDNSCNWMVDSPVHPGACTVSEAVLCAGNNAGQVIEWAFSEQERLREAATNNPGSEREIVLGQFPHLKSCLGSDEVRSKIHKSLRWAARNQIQVLTPQLYVAGVKLCDEDVDLGLEHTLTHMLARHRAGTLKATEVPELPAIESWRKPIARVMPEAINPSAGAVPSDATPSEAVPEADTALDVPAGTELVEPTQPAANPSVDNTADANPANGQPAAGTWANPVDTTATLIPAANRAAPEVAPVAKPKPAQPLPKPAQPQPEPAQPQPEPSETAPSEPTVQGNLEAAPNTTIEGEDR